MIDDMNDANDVELRTGREGPAYTEVHDWVALSGISMTALGLYNLLRMHVNRKRGDKYVWLSTLTLAILCGLSRGDKLKPYLDELAELGAIDIERSGLHRRNIYTVHSLPPAGYRGPLDIKDWHERSKEKLDSIRDAEKAKRDARRAKQKEGKGQVSPVTPGRGEQDVTPETGEPVHPETGEPVTPSRGREPKEAQPKEVEPSVPPSEVRRRAIEESVRSKQPAKGSAVQTTLDGEDEDLDEKEPTPEQVAFRVARGWIEYRAKQGAPVAGGNPLHQLKSLVLPFLQAEYTEDEVKRAINGIGEGIPSKGQMSRALGVIRGVRPTSGAGYGGGRRAPVVDVNEAWKDQSPQFASAGATERSGW